MWDNEAGSFTPWMAQEENIKLLGDAIGIELEVQAQEKDVGPFRADILCKDTAKDAWVLIEAKKFHRAYAPCVKQLKPGEAPEE